MIKGIHYFIEDSSYIWGTEGEDNKTVFNINTIIYNFDFSNITKTFTATLFDFVSGKNIYFEQLYIEPSYRYYDIITKHTEENIYFQNRYYFSDKILTIDNITQIGVSTEYFRIDLLNKTFKAGEYLYNTFVIPERGDIKVEGEFIFNDTAQSITNSFSYSLIRAVVIPFIPDEYFEIVKYLTSISRTRTLKEQRRSISDLPLLEITYNKKLRESDLDKFINIVEYGQGKVLVCPIVSENFTPSSALNSNQITVNQNLKNYFFIDYVNYLIIIDEQNQNNYFFSEITSVDKTANTIYIKDIINKTFDKPIIFLANLFMYKDFNIEQQDYKTYNMTLGVSSYVGK